MKELPDYIVKNKHSWNERTGYHIKSDFYDNESFLKGRSSLNETELSLLGDISGKKILHLQCHFGQDTISLARMGAKVTGVDFSEKAIDEAKKFAAQTGTDTTFICCDIYDLPEYSNETFDIVFTSYGTIGWLPDLERWAKIIEKFLVPNGIFIFVEFHPVIWMFDDAFEKVQYNYFNQQPIIETTENTYADKQAMIKTETVSWNHSLSEVISNLLSNNLELEYFTELDYSPYNCFNETVEVEPGKFRIKHLGNNIPMLYAIKARKKINFSNK